MATADQYEAIRMAMCEYLGREPRDLQINPFGRVCVYTRTAEDERRAFWRARRLIGDDSLRCCEECYVHILGAREWYGPHSYRLHCEHAGDDLAMTSTNTNTEEQHQ